MAKSKKTKPSKAKKDITLKQRGTKPILTVGAATDETQLLVTLRRKSAEGGTSWLSPLGWGDTAKSTLLDCYSEDGHCEIIIPDTYAACLETGDAITLRCKDLGVNATLDWTAESKAAAMPTPAISTAAATTGGAASVLMSRLFKKSLSEDAPAPVAEAISDTSLEALQRATDAQKLADDYKAQMDRAAKAREKAQAEALAAARRAEDALQAEAERIAEMERAAQAYAEAEAQRQDEERRLEAERRAHEARIAEEARLLEEARQREIAAAREAECQAARANILAVIGEASDQRSALSERIQNERSQIHRLTVDGAAKEESLIAFRKEAENGDSELTIAADSLKIAQTNLTGFQDRLSLLSVREQDAQQSLKASEAALAEAQRLFEDARIAANQARAHAKDMKDARDAAETAKAAVHSKCAVAAKDKEAIAAQCAAADRSFEESQSFYDSLQMEADAAHADIESVERDIEVLAEAKYAGEASLEQLQGQMAVINNRQDAAKAALEALDSGSDAASARAILAAGETALPMKKELVSDIESESDTGSFMGKLRAAKDSIIAVESEPSDYTDADSETLLFEEVDIEEAAIASKLSRRPSRRAGLLMGAALAMAVLGVSAANLMPKTQPRIAAVQKPDTKAVLSVKTPEITAEPIKERLTPAPTSSIAVAPIDAPAPAAEKLPAKRSAIPEFKTPEVKTPAPTKTAALAPAAIPSLDVLSMARKAARKSPAPKIRAKRVRRSVPAAPVKQAIKAIQPVKLAAVTRPAQQAPLAAPSSVAPAPLSTVPASPKNNPDVTREVQGLLDQLGFYSGEVNGQTDSATRESMALFQQLYSLPESSVISTEFLAALRNTAASQSAAIAAVPEPAPVSVEIYQPASEPPPVPVAAVIAEPVQSAEVTAIPDAAPAQTAIEPTIVEAVQLSSIRARYPRNATRKDVYVNADVMVAYDISESGDVINAVVVSSSYQGRQSSSFESAALRSVSQLKFSPRKEDGQIVVSKGHTKLVKYRGQ